jgi:hypothetical protein
VLKESVDSVIEKERERRRRERRKTERQKGERKRGERIRKWLEGIMTQLARERRKSLDAIIIEREREREREKKR